MKQYKFNTEKIMDIIEKIYPKEAGMLLSKLDCNSFTKENLDKIVFVIKETIENPIIEEVSKEVELKEEITCFSDKTNKVMNEIFHNQDLFFFGHGGNADAIMNDKFRCRYPELQSHFIGLSSTNQSLEILKDWPHLHSKKIAILAINKHEFNPLYREREKKNTYDTDIYSIENEYFVGYYDAEKDEFIKNPKFKMRHEFDPEAKLYPSEMVKITGLFVDGPDEIVNIYKELDYLRKILFFSSYTELDEIGYKKLEQQILYRISEIYKLQEKITPEFIKEQANKTNIEQNDEELEDETDFGIWPDEEEWGFPKIDSEEKNKKTL